MFHLDIVRHTAAALTAVPAATITFYSLVLTAIAAYIQIVRDINVDLVAYR